MFLETGGQRSRCRPLRRLCVLGAVVALSLAPAAPRAQEAVTPAQRAEQLAGEALEMFNARRFNEAAALFLRAFELQPTPRYLFNAARAHEVVGDLANAVPLFDRYEHLEPPPPDSADVHARLVDLRAALARTHGLLQISTTPRGALVTLDGKPAGAAPLERWVTAGVHAIHLANDGHIPSDKTIQVDAGATATLTVVLEPEAKAGALVLGADVDGADVYLDNRYVGISPLRLDAVSPGRHAISLKKAGYEDWSGHVEVRTGEAATVRTVLVPVVVGAAPDGSLDLTLAGGLTLGGGAALLGASVAMHVLAFDAADEANALSPEGVAYASDFDDLKQRGEALQVTAFVGYSLAAVAIGAGITMLVLPDDDGAATRFTPVPWIGDGVAGASAVCRF